MSVFCQRSGLSSVSAAVCLLSAQRSVFCQRSGLSSVSVSGLSSVSTAV
ncbi:MAG: hypothetical protein IJS92_03770 [Paludibacteraceae bacterium]|nr:hypothetical protein [Paludibacteraceae bacterium]